MIGLDLSGCVYKKRVKMRNKQHFTASCIWYILLYFVFVILSVFLKFPTPSQNVEFHIHRIHLEIGPPEEIKFCIRKMIKWMHFIFPCKMINLFQDVVKNFFQKNVSYGLRLQISTDVRKIKPCIHPYIHTYIHTYTHIYIRIHIYT